MSGWPSTLMITIFIQILHWITCQMPTRVVIYDLSIMLQLSFEHVLPFQLCTWYINNSVPNILRIDLWYFDFIPCLFACLFLILPDFT